MHRAALSSSGEGEEMTKYPDADTALMRGYIFPEDDEHAGSSSAQRMAELLEAIEEESNYRKRQRLQDLYREAYLLALYGSVSPKQIPSRAVRQIFSLKTGTREADRDLRDKSPSVSAAIRAVCSDCQGHRNHVIGCSSVTCALWPFRMGTNPLFGRVEGSEDEVAEGDENADNQA